MAKRRKTSLKKLLKDVDRDLDAIFEHEATHPLGPEFRISGPFDVSLMVSPRGSKGYPKGHVTVYVSSERYGSWTVDLPRVDSRIGRSMRRSKESPDHYHSTFGHRMSLVVSHKIKNYDSKQVLKAFLADRELSTLFSGSVDPNQQNSFYLDTNFLVPDLLTALAIVTAVERVGKAHGFKVEDWS